MAAQLQTEATYRRLDGSIPLFSIAVVCVFRCEERDQPFGRFRFLGACHHSGCENRDVLDFSRDRGQPWKSAMGSAI